MSAGREALDLSLLELSAALAARRLSSREVTEAALSRVEATDGRLGAFLAVTAGEAREQAAAADARAARGERRSPLDGVPLALKDLFLTRGVATTAGSRILEGFVPPYDATVVERLRAAGAVLLGKLNLDEFAMGSSTENSAFKPCRNPWDLSRTPGRLVGRQRGGGGGAPGLRRAGHRHRRLHPRAGRLLRRGRAEAHLRPRLALRRHRLRLLARPAGAHRPHRG